MNRVLVLHEKHAQRILDVSTDELLYEAAHAVLTGRSKEAWYDDFDADDDKRLEKILAVPPSRDCWRFLLELSSREYERVEIVGLTTLDEMREG